jgi:flagellar biosynthesis/type III secretory pathway protein FliH
MERQGYRSVVAERLREEYENRVRARAEKSAAAEPAAAEPADAESAAADSAAKIVSTRPQSLEEIRREARESWLRFKESRSQNESQGQGKGKGPSQGHLPSQGRAGAAAPVERGPARDDGLAY